LEQGEQRREPSFAVYDPFSTSAATHFTTCFADAPVIAQACTISSTASCTLTTSMAMAAPVVPATPVAPAPPSATAAPPLLGDADGPAHAATAITADPPLPNAIDGPAHAATTMTDMGTYILMATMEDFQEFGDDPTALPLVLVYKGEILISSDNTPLSLGVSTVLQEFDDVFLEEVPAGLPPLHGIEHQIDLIPGATLPNRAPYWTNPDETMEIQKKSTSTPRQRLYSSKFEPLCCSCYFGS
jgi:hypothetical protein